MKKYDLRTFDPYKESTHIVVYDDQNELVDGVLFTGKIKNRRRVFKKYSEMAKEYFPHLIPKYGMMCISAMIQHR